MFNHLVYIPTDNNKSITLEEMQLYVTEEVGFMAGKLNHREQTPQLDTSDKNRVLVQY